MIQLWFNGHKEPELVRVHYSCPITGSSRRSYRGRGTWHGDGSFQWTLGVKALCCLLIDTALNESHGSLDGAKGSLAASLDFALGKPPAWLREMFGVVNGNQPITNKLFTRLNPEGKRDAPFQVLVNNQYINSASIQIFIDGSLLTQQQLTQLYKLLTGNETQSTGTLLSSNNFLTAIDEHLVRAYNSIDVFTRTGRDTLLKRIHNHPGFRKFAPLNSKITHHVDDELSSRARLGIVDEDVLSVLRSRKEPIRITSNMPTIPITILFQHMKSLYNLPLEIDMSHLHAAEVGKRIIAKDFLNAPDLCVLGLGPSCAILSQKEKAEYVPISPLPASYDELLCGLAPENMTKDSYFSFIDDFPSTPRLFFERLSSSTSKNKNINPVEHFEPADSIAKTLQEKNARTILFFPYNVVAKIHYGLHADTSLNLGGNVTEMLLFGKKEFASDSRFLKAFLIAMRDTWLRIRTDSALRNSLRNELVTSEEYKRIFCRAIELPLLMAA